MNYLAHGYCYVDRPYFLAGTALPDWLRVCGRRLRPSAVGASRGVVSREGGAPGELSRELASGSERHYHDDFEFHTQAGFLEVSRQVTAGIRSRFPERRRLRRSFLGHVLTEMLLDSFLAKSRPDLLYRYYDALETIDSEEVQSVANGWLARSTDRLASVIGAFRRHRFLWDYLDDRGLSYRLGQVTRRVGLPELPPTFVDVVSEARELVERRSGELLRDTV